MNDKGVVVHSNGSISTAHLNSGSIHFKLWDKGDTTEEPRKFVITPKEAPRHLFNYQINGNFVVVRYESDRMCYPEDHYDMWYLTEPGGYLISEYIPLDRSPDRVLDHQLFDLFLTEDQVEMTQECYWLLDTNPNSKYFVKLYSIECCGNFVLVLDGFTSSKLRHRIQMPDDVFRIGDVVMRIVGTGKDAKTVLIAPATYRPYQVFVYDMLNAQMVLKIPLKREHTSFGQYLFPDDLTNDDLARGGVDVIRIDYNGQNWTSSSFFASYGHVEKYDGVTLHQVTDTQTLWEVERGRDSYSILCDYLLNDLDTHRLDYYNHIILSDTDSDI